jgi:hypothetical protein
VAPDSGIQTKIGGTMRLSQGAARLPPSLSLSLVLRSWQPVLDRLLYAALSHCIARASYLTVSTLRTVSAPPLDHSIGLAREQA